jgi:2-oxoglutarate ferredoxin oxidoreductase subunit alpha
LIAMNSAALKTNLADLNEGGILICNEDAYDAKGLKQAGYAENPLEDDSLNKYNLFKVPMTKLTRAAVEGLGLSQKEADRCRNFFAMGLIFWLYSRDTEPTLRFIEDKFGSKPAIAEANRKALMSGWYFGETTDAFVSSYKVDKAKLGAGTYKNMTGNTAMAYGLVAASKLSDRELFLGSYPITPASDILHELSKFKNFGVRTFQAEDEIAAICSAIGASFGGKMALTTSSGPGICLKGEAMGLAMIYELPLLIINIQRGGPSTGLPTKTEQSDLMQAMFGRNGECPIPIISASSPGDCFDVAIEAWRIAATYMTPVMILSDGFIANGAEPWRIPEISDLPKIEIKEPRQLEEGETFLPYERDDKLARPWAAPGLKGHAHRLGGIEKAQNTGNVSYDPENHQEMTEIRAAKVANIAKDIPLQEVHGPDSGDLLVLSWGGTYGSCLTAVEAAQKAGKKVAHTHLRYINPFPSNLGELLKRYDKVLMPELNMGQLRLLIRAEFLVDAIGLNKVQGKPFPVSEVLEKINEILA